MTTAEITTSFVLLWTVIDPIGTVPVFIASTRKHPENDRIKIAIWAVGIATATLLFFLVVGQILLDAMKVPLTAFQVSGGIVLFLFALTMIFGESKPEEEVRLVRSMRDTAAFPLAMPSIASPGAILAVMLLTDNNRYSFGEQAVTAGMLLIIMAITFVILLGAGKIHKWIGEAGATVISKISGLLLCAVAANSVLLGIREFFAVVPK